MSRWIAWRAGQSIRVAYGMSEGVRIALESVRSNMVRSGLTILGISIGVGVVMIMAALITGIRGSIQNEIEAAGPRNFHVIRVDPSEAQIVQDGSRPSWWDRPSLRIEEVERTNDLPAVHTASLGIALQDPGTSGGVTLEFEDIRITGVPGVGEFTRWPEHRATVFTEGRNFVDAEVRQAQPVVVLTEGLARELFGNSSPIGHRIRAQAGGNTLLLTVIGVVATRPPLFQEQPPDLAIVPYTTALQRLGASDQGSQMTVVPRDDTPIDAAEDQVIGLLRTIRGLAPETPNDFSILRSTQLLELFDDFTGVFFIVMLALSSVGLLVGGVGVVGIMLISVTERTREIGIRKAAGATRGEILWQFLVEAGVLTFLGAAVGLLLGGTAAEIVAATTPIPASIPAWSVAAALGMAGVTGMLFGLLPAVRAARMEPVTALRYE